MGRISDGLTPMLAATLALTAAATADAGRALRPGPGWGDPAAFDVWASPIPAPVDADGRPRRSRPARDVAPPGPVAVDGPGDAASDGPIGSLDPRPGALGLPGPLTAALDVPGLADRIGAPSSRPRISPMEVGFAPWARGDAPAPERARPADSGGPPGVPGGPGEPPEAKTYAVASARAVALALIGLGGLWWRLDRDSR